MAVIRGLASLGLGQAEKKKGPEGPFVRATDLSA
jgi:hypothetical protein